MTKISVDFLSEWLDNEKSECYIIHREPMY